MVLVALGVMELLIELINWNTKICQGHIHTESSIIYHANQDSLIWSMQLPAAFNVTSYAANYAKNFTKKPIISVGVILGKWKFTDFRANASLVNSF